MQDIVIGVDLGGTNIKAGAVSPKGKVLYRTRLSTSAGGGPEAVADEVSEAVRQCRAGVAEGAGRVVGAGIGSPGAMDAEGELVRFAPNLEGFTDVPLRELVEERIGMPCTLDNDANAAALGEQWVGAGAGASSLVMLTLGTGIGGGIVLGGRVWRGFAGAAGEIGHMSIHPEGPPCGCGNRGCIEAFASATAMVRRMKEAIEAGRPTRLTEKARELTARDIYEAACEGDEAAVENVTMTGRYLGLAIANIMHILNPEVIVMSGGVTAAGEMLIRPIRDEVRRRAMEASRENVRILFASLGEDAGLIGAARSFMLRQAARWASA